MNTKLVCILILCVLSSFVAGNGGSYPVSMIQLISTPERYLGKKIEVRGYFQLGIFPAIYPNLAYAEIRDVPSALEVVDSSPDGQMSLRCNSKYILVKGRFVEHEKHYEIRDVEKVIEVKSLKPCWVKEKKGVAH